jgi:prepilin-type N-terminal cleavage/methylation domain-containing protein
MSRLIASNPKASEGFTLKRRSRGAFTLIELLVVIGIISLLLVVIIPAVNSLSKSGGRKAAIANLLGAIEQARAQAIKDGQATYVVFPDQLPAGADNAAIQRYSYRSYAIFEDDPANAGSVKQITRWTSLPAGVSLRSGSLNYLANTIQFPFTPLGAGAKGNFPFLKFSTDGTVDATTTRNPNNTSGTIQFGVFEGFVDSNGEHATSQASESIQVYRLTGRAERM